MKLLAMNLRFPALLLLMIHCHSSQAITNIESERLNNAKAGTRGNINLSLDGRIGSSDKVALGTSVKIIRAFEHEEWITILSRDYAEVDRKVNTDETFLHLRHLRKHNPNWGREVFTQYQEDRFALLEQRILLGAGIRYTLTPTNEKLQANHFGLGLFYETEKYVGTTENEYGTRLNAYWAFKNRLNDVATYTSTLYFQPKLNDLSDEKGLWQNALTVNVTRTISLSLSWDVEHDTRTPDGANATETRYDSVLIYHF